jgi:Lipocalin-like domain
LEVHVSDDPKKAIIGAWRLVHLIEYRPDGTPDYPFGEDPIGYIVYSESGVMAIQITRQDRGGDAARSLGVGSDYLAYFGRYEVHVDNQLVRHFLEGQLHPGNHPDTLDRKYRFYDDKLSLRPCDGVDRETLWQRT